MNKDTFLVELKRTVLACDEEAQVILFGSRARGDFKPDSDWDVLVLTAKELAPEKKRNLRNAVYKVELDYAQAVTIMVIDANQWHRLSITGFYEKRE